ncbi:carboxyphosphonoenolpyruvate phosphonomutase-like protein [Aspergillus steynii IBT 23096]|uniref:Carboxyphosphonoenolpyruvate phosphonomutase-like protein n=1 Tax=Aspergillus steynii IBT 23096 TaxID=1392250 RepID=A0A2I2FRH2_9EURO|nr:carboxyphosphonoenolpyruvate phosphonomutase-like protein [Aspergillus steynii IBT 23096]PLB43206.1 carboxyphosphonoenolpyruvate phosphonomutase-like protein [Aspergillus steynii IBT 23096]
MSTQNDRAIYFRSLHRPGNPIVLSNIYDGATASYIAAHASTKAIATASYAIAASQGVADESLTLSQNLASVRTIASVVAATSPQLPLTVDAQDGYEDVAQTVREIIALGAVGCNIEDFDNRAGTLRSLPDAVARIRTAVQAAKDAGVPDFVINARTDILGPAGTGVIADAIQRGQAFLEAGACTVFVWGGPGGRGVSGAEVRELVAALGGRVNVKLNLAEGSLTVAELKQIGVARISLGPELWRAAMGAFRETADRLLAGVSYD